MAKISPASSKKHSALFDKAHKAGVAAAEAKVPVPMIVGEAAGLFSNEFKPGAQLHYVAGGICGFAWVVVSGRSGFAQWGKQNHKASNAYGGGVQFRASVGGQSMEKKEAYAHAFASVLTEAGIKAYVESRMD